MNFQSGLGCVCALGFGRECDLNDDSFHSRNNTFNRRNTDLVALFLVLEFELEVERYAVFDGIVLR